MNRFEIVKKYNDEYDYYDLLACGAPNDEFLETAKLIRKELYGDSE